MFGFRKTHLRKENVNYKAEAVQALANERKTNISQKAEADNCVASFKTECRQQCSEPLAERGTHCPELLSAQTV